VRKLGKNYTSPMSVFVNRMLNLKKIKVLGFDMDYTLVRYHIEAFERLSHEYARAYLVKENQYPEELMNLDFDVNRAIVGLVIDKQNGNLLKLNRYGKVKIAYHGLEEIDFRLVRKTYQNMAIDFKAPEYIPLDTFFAISTGVLFSQIVQMKKDGFSLPEYHRIATDVVNAVDMVHRNGSIKSVILKDFSKYVIVDTKVPQLLERYKDYGKKLMVITNSDYYYTKALMEYAMDPYWKHHKSWTEVFDLVITFADKPRFFERPGRFLKIDPETGFMKNHEDTVASGIYQGGWFRKLQDDLEIEGSEILYIGDHIYGDVVSIKRRCDWRTALVLGDLEREIEGIKASRNIHEQIENLMAEKAQMERTINQMDLDRYEGKSINRPDLDALFEATDQINRQIADLLNAYRAYFNPFWGEVLRAGQEESRYADQIDKYACIYMTKVSDLYDYSPKTYFRPFNRVMPHERL